MKIQEKKTIKGNHDHTEEKKDCDIDEGRINDLDVENKIKRKKMRRM